MVKAIVARLATGSIKNFTTRGGSVSMPLSPYCVVWEGTPDIGGTDIVGVSEVIINTHFPQGNWAELDTYVFEELVTLVKNYIFTAVGSGRKFKLNITKKIGDIVAGNDDGTISRERTFTTLKFY